MRVSAKELFQPRCPHAASIFEDDANPVIAQVTRVSGKIVVAVGIASQPISAAGNTWNSLNWTLGFRELGWDVWITEAIDSVRCTNASRQPESPEQSANLAYWREIVGRFAFNDRATLLIDGAACDIDRFHDFCAEADLFLNLSGHFKCDAVSFPRALKVYQDGDPAFSQIWAENYGCDMNFAAHDRFITAGLQLGQPSAFSPTCDIEWIPTFPPVVLKYWPYTPREAFDRFTSVAHWEGYKSSEWRGQWFHGKREEFQKFVDVPSKVSRPIELATDVASHASELEAFRQGGWRFTDATLVCGTLDAYGDYIRGSSAEFSIAKGGYVLSQTGWFSDRAVCYAASGKPLVAQDTGLGGALPVGDGFHCFRTPAEAITACEHVIADFTAQQGAARALAEEYFDSNRVLTRLINRLNF